jgi:hypothetical protein
MLARLVRGSQSESSSGVMTVLPGTGGLTRVDSLGLDALIGFSSMHGRWLPIAQFFPSEPFREIRNIREIRGSDPFRE